MNRFVVAEVGERGMCALQDEQGTYAVVDGYGLTFEVGQEFLGHPDDAGDVVVTELPTFRRVTVYVHRLACDLAAARRLLFPHLR